MLGALSAADRREFEAHSGRLPRMPGAVTESCGARLLSQLDSHLAAAISESALTVVASGLAAGAGCRSLPAAALRRRRRTSADHLRSSVRRRGARSVCWVGAGPPAAPQRGASRAADGPGQMRC